MNELSSERTQWLLSDLQLLPVTQSAWQNRITGASTLYHFFNASWEEFSELLIFTDVNRLIGVNWMSSGAETIHLNNFSNEANVQLYSLLIGAAVNCHCAVSVSTRLI
jgi:hypothetical protein